MSSGKNLDWGRRQPPPSPLPTGARRTRDSGRRLAGALLAAALGASLAATSAATAASATAAHTLTSTTALTSTKALSTSTAVSAAAKRRLDITLTKVSPAAVGPTTPLVVSGVVRNTGTSAIKKGKVTLRLHQGLLDGRTGVQDWVDEGTLSATDFALNGAAELKTLAPNQTTSFTVTVPAGQAGLTTLNSFGPRGITLDGTANGTSVGTLRSTFVWMPGEPASRTRLSLAVPLVAEQASTVSGSATAAAATSLEPGGHLDRVLSATADKAIAWAVDPSVLTAAQRLSTGGVTTSDVTATGEDDPDASATPASSPSSSVTATGANEQAEQAAGTWLNGFRTGAHGRGLIGLPYADPDLTAVLRSKDSVPLLTSADQLGGQAATAAAGMRLDNSIAWPAEGKINEVTAGRLASNGRTAVILDASTQPAEQAASITPTGRGTVQTRGGSLDSLLYDDQLSGLFASSGTQQGAQATQTFLAELAAITRESSTVRSLLAVAPRDWNPNPAGVQALLKALRAAPWVSLRGINDLRSTEPTVARTTVKYGSKAKNAELPMGHVSFMLALRRNLTAFAPALYVADPDTARKRAELVVRTQEEHIASMLSVAWRDERTQVVSARTAVGDTVDDLVGGVKLRGGGGTLTGKSASLPLYVDNRTDYPVKVRLQLKPSSGQVAFANDLVVTVPAKQLLPVQVPTRSLANGNVQVEARLLTDQGGQVGTPLTFTVKVRPSWETVGMIVVGSVLGLLFVLGLLRSIRRGRRRGRVHPDSVPDLDDQASQRADAVPNSGSDSDATLSSTDGLSRPDPESEGLPEVPDTTRSPAMPRETR